MVFKTISCHRKNGLTNRWEQVLQKKCWYKSGNKGCIHFHTPVALPPDLFQRLFVILFKGVTMSQAFIRESDDQWLDDVAPTLTALIHFLTRENNGIRVYEKRSYTENGRDVFEMSNGLAYTKDNNGRWHVMESK